MMAVASSLGITRRLGLYDTQELEDRILNYVMAFQRKDGSFPYSKDYLFIPDNRSYPRTLSMMLYHLLNKRLDINTTLHKERTAR